MFILDPINSITSVKFYKKVSSQSGLRTAGYLGYLGLLFALMATIAFKVRLGPAIDSTFAWLQAQVPTLIFANGKVTAPSSSGPTTIVHPTIPELALHIDVNRVEPVTPQTMDELKVKAYLAQSALYLIDPNGRLQVSDFSKSQTDKTLTVDAAFFRQAQSLLARALYPVALVLSFGFFLLWKSFSSVFYSLVAMAVNAVHDAKLEFGALFNIAVYAQTLIIALQTIFLFMKAPLPLSSLISLAATTTYIWLAVKAAGAPAQSPEA